MKFAFASSKVLCFALYGPERRRLWNRRYTSPLPRRSIRDFQISNNILSTVARQISKVLRRKPSCEVCTFGRTGESDGARSEGAAEGAGVPSASSGMARSAEWLYREVGGALVCTLSSASVSPSPVRCATPHSCLGLVTPRVEGLCRVVLVVQSKLLDVNLISLHNFVLKQ